MSLLNRSVLWQFGLSAYWFAVSLKWFVLLTAILPAQVREMVPGGEEGTYWGRVVMLGAIWAMFGPALFGYISDRTRARFGKWKPYVALGSALTVVALMVLSNPENYLVIVLGYLLLQVSDDIGQGPYSALIPSLVSEEQRGRASGIMAFLQMSAQFAGGVLAIQFLVLERIDLLYVSLALINILCALITIIVVREKLLVTEKKQEKFWTAWIKPWKDRDFRWLWFTRFLNALGFYFIYTYLLYYLIDVVKVFSVFGVFEISPEDSSPEALKIAAQKTAFILILFISTIAAIGAFVGGKLSDEFGRKKVIFWSSCAMASAVIPIAIFANFSLLVVMALIFGLAYGVFQSAGWAIASDVIHDSENVATDMGLWQSSIASTQILSGMSGMLLDFMNRVSMGYGYSMIFIFASIAFFFSAVFIKKVIRSH